MSGCTSLAISRAPRLLVRKMNERSKFTTVLSPRLSEPLSRMPSSSTVSEGAAFSTSSNSTRDRSQPDDVTADSRSCVSIGLVSRCPRYPGGAPMSLATS